MAAVNTGELRLQLFHRVVDILVEATGPETDEEANEMRDDYALLVEDLFDGLEITVTDSGDGTVTIQVSL